MEVKSGMTGGCTAICHYQINLMIKGQLIPKHTYVQQHKKNPCDAIAVMITLRAEQQVKELSHYKKSNTVQVYSI